MDLIKPQLMQGTFASRSEAMPVGATAANVCLKLLPEDAADPELVIRAEIQGYNAAQNVWRTLAAGELPGPSVTEEDCRVDRLRVVIDPNRPVSAGATITFI